MLLSFGVSWLYFQSNTSLMLEKRNKIYISLPHNSDQSAVTVWDLHWCNSMKFGTGNIFCFITPHITCLLQPAICRGVSPVSG